MTELVKSEITNLKHLPGVYLMHDKDDNIIYIGKAKDLQKRVSQYFLRPQTGKTAKMVSCVDHFEVMITNNEKEALILESNLIKHHNPRYNILLRDDSHYPYIALRKGNDPVLSIKRNKNDKNYYYFGPYPNARSATEVINLLNKIFPLRKCKVLPSKPCVYYSLGQCLAPCINKIDDKEYQDISEKIRNFLSGDIGEVKREYQQKLKTASNNMQYELAGEYKSILDSLEHMSTVQTVEMKDKKDRDIFAFSSRDDFLSLVIFNYVGGILLGKKSFVLDRIGEEEEQVSELILQYYESHPLPKEIIINNDNIKNELEKYLDVSIYSKTKGNLYSLVLLAKENANNALDEYFLTPRINEESQALLEELSQLLDIPFPTRIEMFDNSHLAGEEAVGVMVAFINGERAPKLYRKYKINESSGKDDLASMKEVLTRRLSKIINENDTKPDLILLDGGYTQLEVGIEVLKTLNLDIPIFSLVKDNHHTTRAIVNKDNKIISIEDKSLFYLLTRMQDEVHRFAITYHKDKRNKAMFNSYLDNIPGIGQKRKEKLLSLYPTKEMLLAASREELEEIIPSFLVDSLLSNLTNK